MKKTIGILMMTTLLLNASPLMAFETDNSDVNGTVSKIQDLLKARELEKQAQIQVITNLKKRVALAEERAEREAVGGVISVGMIALSIYMIKTNSGDSFARSFTLLGAEVIGAAGVAGTAYNAYKLTVNLKNLPEFKRALLVKEAELRASDLKLKQQIEALKNE